MQKGQQNDRGIQPSLQEILQAEGCVVETAGDGREGLARLAAEGFDVVLTDVVMPEIDGYDFFCAIRERYPDLPVLMMTAFHYDRDHVIKRSRVEGLCGVIFKKPVDPKRLCEVLLETTGPRRPLIRIRLDYSRRMLERPSPRGGFAHGAALALAASVRARIPGE